MYRKIGAFLLPLFLLTILTGCADIQKPKPQSFLSHPWNSNKSSIRLGDTKEIVLDKWGNPTEVIKHGVDQWGLEQEEWVYKGKFPDIPVDYNYFSKTKYLYFDGNNLIGYKDEEEAKKKVKEK